MMPHVFTLTADLGRPSVFVALALGVLGIVLLAVELRRRGRGAPLIAATGLVATALLVLAVLRPASVASRDSVVGPRIVVLADRSRSMELPGDEGTRRETLDAALARIRASAGQARLRVLRFGEGPAKPWETKAPLELRSDLSAALASLGTMPDERPSAIIVLSDGRLDRPTADAVGVRDLAGSPSVPVHTVSLATGTPRDASVRAVRAAGAAVAHQALPITIQIGCEGLACDDVPVSARELVAGASPSVLSSGIAHVQGGVATVELSITLERAGARIVEIAIDAPPGDEIPDNDRRFLAFDVSRDRVRVLHVAGRPTYDVRALRMWLKANASVDVVAFFILRTRSDEVNATEDDLALIPFPVHELFTEHLPSFDAVILQDFDAAPYELLGHLPALARYVERGGGLVMVGGPESFSGGHYAGTRLADVLPVELEPPSDRTYDMVPFVPVYSDVARAIPVLYPLRALLGEALPEMVGANRAGDARPGSLVLLTHPKLRTRSGAPMPLLSLGEKGDGRSIALALDATYRLAYSALGSDRSGRAHGALWDGLLGWLMRDPRYEPAGVEGEALTLTVRPLPGSEGAVDLTVQGLDQRGSTVKRQAPLGEGPVRIDVGALEPGGYGATVRIGGGPATRRDFACERGGDEWADSRPDVARLRAIAAATGGEHVRASAAGRIPLPPATTISAERRVTPLLAAWVWTVLAAAALGVHWIARRRSGLA
jgi:uncharacterized membrane protein